MFFDDVFYPDNPVRRARVAMLQAECKLPFINFQKTWNELVDILNPLLKKSQATEQYTLDIFPK